MLDPKKQAERIEMLVRDGMELKDAIEKVLSEVTPDKEDRIKWIKTVENMSVLQKQMHKSHAKKSKAKKVGNEEAVQRYNKEIETARDRLEVLRAKAKESEASIQELVKLGAKPSTIIQTWVKEKESEVNKQLEEIKKKEKWGNKDTKKKILEQKAILPEEYVKELKDLGEEYLTNVVERAKRGDQRIITIVKKYHLIHSK